MARDSYNASPYQGWTFNRDDSSGGFGFLTRESSIGSANARVCAGSFENNRWYHVAGVRTGRTIQFYVDGVLASSAIESGAFNMNSSAPIWFGGLQQASPQLFTGMIDDIRLYNSALSGSEVADLAAVPEPLSMFGIAAIGALIGRRRRMIKR